MQASRGTDGIHIYTHTYMYTYIYNFKFFFSTYSSMERGAKYENSESLEIEIHNSVYVWGD